MSDAQFGPGRGGFEPHSSPPPARQETYEHAPLGTGSFDADRLAEITEALGEPAFPATREDLIELARSRQAREAVVVDLRSLPEGAGFGDYDQLLAALGVGAQGDIDRPQLPGGLES
ncbi:MAG: DUF2795 domain-containing protein [Kineosporiaceae bacterium]